MLQRDFYEGVKQKGKQLTSEEVQFMRLWNTFLRYNKVYADADIPAACEKFARAHVDQLSNAESPFRMCFITHLTNLWKFRLLTPQQLHDAISACRAVV